MKQPSRKLRAVVLTVLGLISAGIELAACDNHPNAGTTPAPALPNSTPAAQAGQGEPAAATAPPKLAIKGLSIGMDTAATITAVQSNGWALADGTTDRDIVQDGDCLKPAAGTELIVSSYVAANKLRAGELPALIKAVHQTLSNIDEPSVEGEAEPVAKATPAQIRKSLSDSAHLISFLDGKPYRLLKRHLTGHGLTPESYREKFGLPNDYPMTARGYSAERSRLALDFGLGRKGGRAK
jgi:predicted transcriptional regulator